MMFANGNSKRDDAKRVTKKMADKAARAILKTWEQESEKLNELKEKSAVIIRKMAQRQVDLTNRETGLKVESDDVQEVIDNYIASQTGRLIRLTSGTVRDEVRAFLTDRILEGMSSDEIADDLRAHFSGFEGHKADRVARSETRDAVNAGHADPRRVLRGALCQGD
jgi:hypothetical protein